MDFVAEAALGAPGVRAAQVLHKMTDGLLVAAAAVRDVDGTLRETPWPECKCAFTAPAPERTLDARKLGQLIRRLR